MSPFGDISVAPWLHDQMKVVRHHARGKHRHLKFIERFREKPEEGDEVRTVVEQPHAIVAAIENVVAAIGDNRARSPGHSPK